MLFVKVFLDNRRDRTEPDHTQSETVYDLIDFIVVQKHPLSFPSRGIIGGVVYSLFKLFTSNSVETLHAASPLTIPFQAGLVFRSSQGGQDKQKSSESQSPFKRV